MRSFRHIFGAAALVVATTVGAGMFALPYVVHGAGWVPALVGITVLSALVIYAHVVYARVVMHFGEHRRLPGLARTELGRATFWPAFAAVFLGITFALVAYLLLSARFIDLLVPGIPSNLAIVVFWLAASLPLLLRLKVFVEVETVGTLVKAALVLLVFGLAFFNPTGATIPAFGADNLTLGFGPMLFALAGWTAVAPVAEYLKHRAGLRRVALALALGTIASVLIYACFVGGIAGLAERFTEDAVSGLGGPVGLVSLMAVLGLVAVWTPYLTIGLEIKDMIMDDLKTPAAVGLGAAIFLPPLLILGGFTSYFLVVSLSGGFLLSIQYLLILLIGRRVLRPRGWSRLALNASMLVFCAAALAEAWRFF